MTVTHLKGDRERCLAGGNGRLRRETHTRQGALQHDASAVWDFGDRGERSSGDARSREEFFEWADASCVMTCDPVLRKIVAETMLQEAPRMIAAVRQALADGDPAALRPRAAHAAGIASLFSGDPCP